VLDFMKIIMPRQRQVVKLYSDPEPLFHKMAIEKELQKIYLRTVQLEHGGSIVIDRTEALVAIDVNSGRFVSEANTEETAYKVNMAAAQEIGRQIRLRDLGGVIVIDFIDMDNPAHRHDVEETLWNGLRTDRARIKMLHMSKFCIVEMTRQRMRESLQVTHYEPCATCGGTGRVKSPESVALDAFRALKSHLSDKRLGIVEVSVNPRASDHLQNEKRHDLAVLEETSGIKVRVRAATDLGFETMQIALYDKEGNKLKG
jgi:ribonuclease E